MRAFRSICKSGVLLAVVGQDYDRNLIPIAFAHCGSENADNWVYLLRFLVSCFPSYPPLLRALTPAAPGMTASSDEGVTLAFVTDLGVGLHAALPKVFAAAHYIYCIIHREVCATIACVCLFVVKVPRFVTLICALSAVCVLFPALSVIFKTTSARRLQKQCSRKR